jgi:hypothetical protein
VPASTAFTRLQPPPFAASSGHAVPDGIPETWIAPAALQLTWLPVAGSAQVLPVASNPLAGALKGEPLASIPGRRCGACDRRVP